MLEKIGIFNFDNIYCKQNFYLQEQYEWIDCTDLSGVNGYCDPASFEVLKSRMNRELSAKVNYIDSGNYHYVTYLLLQRLKQDFTLILFDHHTDMQQSLFGEILSCGSWVKWALDENPYLQEVIIVGAKQELIDAIGEKYKGRVHSYSEETIDHTMMWEQFALRQIHYPVYVSVDKDVMEPQEVVTNWDQGVLSINQLQEIYNAIRKKTKILGVDICGESDIHQSNYGLFLEENELNNEANSEILRMIEQEI